jgi:uncharacterized protein
MKKDEVYFVRIDTKVLNEEIDKELFQKHISYVAKLAETPEFYGGGFENNPGGMTIFKFNNYDDAKNYCDNDPIIKSGHYKYDLYQWKLIVAKNS